MIQPKIAGITADQTHLVQATKGKIQVLDAERDAYEQDKLHCSFHQNVLSLQLFVFHQHSKQKGLPSRTKKNKEGPHHTPLKVSKAFYMANTSCSKGFHSITTFLLTTYLEPATLQPSFLTKTK